jgi:alpha-L-fucosidase
LDKEEKDWKSVDELLNVYNETIEKNGNFLLNISLDKEGNLNKIEKKRLKEFGRCKDKKRKIDN